MEQFDILDFSGERTGLTAYKGTLLSNGQYYLGVHAYICNSSNEFLIQQRALDKGFRPGGWDIHMGHVISGETSKTAIKREVQEEIGLKCRIGDFRFIGRTVWEAYHHMIDVYLIQTDFAVNELSLQKEEVIGVKVISLNDMLALIANMDYRPLEYREMVSYALTDLMCRN
jgi:isopentenyldiphosphate isomerase